jgi:hypothetical protein
MRVNWPPFAVRSWRGALYDRDPAWYDDDTDDAQEAIDARPLHELRGLIIGQVAEIESLMISLAASIDERLPSRQPVRQRRSGAGGALAEVRKRLEIMDLAGQLTSQLDVIQIVICRRNSLVHGTIHVGSSRLSPAERLEAVIILLVENNEPDSRPMSLDPEHDDTECDSIQLTKYLSEAYIALEAGIDIWAAVEHYFGTVSQ